jgi:hypothetical protein
MVATRDVSVLAMRYDWRNNSVLFVHNLGLDYLLKRSDAAT